MLSAHAVFAQRACLVVGLLLGATPARAGVAAPDPKALASGEPMRFAIVRSAEPACEPTCAEWILAEGKILPGNTAGFARILKTAGKRRLPVMMNSPGGSVTDAIAMGRLIRRYGLDVAVARTQIEGCAAEDRFGCKTPPAGPLRGSPVSARAYCASACTLLFAGGVGRFAAPWSGLGVHQITTIQTRTRVHRVFRITKFVSPTREIELNRSLLKETRTSTTNVLTTPPPAVDNRVHAYLRDMTGNESLVPLMVATPATSIHWMSRPEQQDTKLTSQPVGGEVLALLAAAPGRAVLSDGARTFVAPIEWRFAKDDREGTMRLTGRARFDAAKTHAVLSIVTTADPKAPATHRLLADVRVDPNPQRPGEPDPSSPFAHLMMVGMSDIFERTPEGAPRDPFFPRQGGEWLATNRLGEALASLRTGTRVHLLLLGNLGRMATVSFDTRGAAAAVGEAVAAWGFGPALPEITPAKTDATARVQ